MAKKAKRYEKENFERDDIDYGLLPGFTHVAYMNPVPYEQKEHFGSDGIGSIRADHEKKLHKALI